MFEIIVKKKFSAAHRITGYPGDCSKLHGHNWLIELRLGVEKLNDLGMAFDFRKAKDILEECMEKLDHTCLNDNPFLDGGNPTAERLAEIIFNELKQKVPDDVSVLSVEVWESDNAGVRYWKR